MINKIKFTAVLALLVQAASASAAVPGLINFQGRLLDANKLPRTGSYLMTFKICDSLAGACNTPCAVGNACLWTEDQTLTVTNGVFAAQLGAVAPLDPAVFSAAARYLDITVAGETLSPRERLASGAFSLKASAADALGTARAINGVNFDGSAAITVPVNSADDTANASAVYPLWTTGVGNAAAKVSTTKLSFVPNTGILTATGFAGSFTGNISGSAATLTTPRAINGVNFDGSAAITVPVNSADDTASSSAVYPLWTAAAGNTAAKVSTSRLSFVPNTGVLTAGGFSGPLTGNVTGNASGSAGTLATPRAINGVNFDGSAAITVPVNSADDVASAGPVYPLWTAATGGNNAAKTSAAKLSYAPATGVLSATGFAGAGGSLTGLNAGNISAGTLPAARGGTGADLSAAAVGALPYFSATGVMSGLAAGSANQLLRSAGGAAPTWTTATYPNTTAINQLLYSNAANTVTGLATANSGLLVTNASGVPAIGTDIPAAVTMGGAYVYRAGGTAVSIADGGTGQATATAAFNALAPTTTKGDIIAEDGTNVIRLGVGANNTVLTADSTQASGLKWADPYLLRYSAAASANVTMTTAGTWYTGTSVAVAAGTYLITAQITMGKASTTADTVYGRIYNGSAAIASGMAMNSTVNPHASTVSLTTIATFAAGVTLSVQGTASVGTALIYAALPTNGQGNNATQITVVALQ